MSAWSGILGLIRTHALGGKLKNSHLSERMDLVQALGETGNAGAVRYLLQALSDGDIWMLTMRGDLIYEKDRSRMLGLFDNVMFGSPALAYELKRPPTFEVRAACERAFVELARRGVKLIPRLEKAKSSSSLPGYAVESLVRAIADVLEEVEIQRKLTAPDGDKRNAGLLLRALGDAEPQVRARAAARLGEMRCSDAVPCLIQLLRATYTGTTQTGAAAGLATSEDVRDAAASALASIGTPAVRALVPLLEDADLCMRAKAAEILGTISDASTVQQLAGLIVDPTAGLLSGPAESYLDGVKLVREAAASALAKIGAPALQSVVTILGASQGAAGEAAWTAFCGIARQCPEGVVSGQLAYFIKHGSKDVRARTVALLKELKNPEAVGPLIEAFGVGDADLRWLAGRALIEKGGSAVTQLVAALQNEDGSVRSYSAYILGEMAAPEALQQLEKLFADSDCTVREEAQGAIGKIRKRQGA